MKQADFFSRGQPPADWFHISQVEKGAAAARKRYRSKFSAAQPSRNRLGRDTEISRYLMLREYERDHPFIVRLFPACSVEDFCRLAAKM